MLRRIYMFVLTAVAIPGAALYGQCDYTVTDLSPCAQQTTTFSLDNPATGVIYTWDFDGDGTIDATGNTVDYAYPLLYTDSTYTVEVYADDISCNSQSITILASPDPSIGVPPGIVILNGNEIKACNGSPVFDLEIYNASATYSENISYDINWGDGTPTESYDNSTFPNFGTISHTFNGFGYYTIFITATHQNGCMYTTTYTFYNGGNPSVGLVIPGNTVGLCAPATLDFPITNTGSNPPGTEYTIFVNGEIVATYDQDNLPEVFTYTFLESSCGIPTSTGNYMNAFDIKIVASNPCNSSTATIEPIEVSEPPTPEFLIIPPVSACPGATFGFDNITPDITEVISGSPSTCVDVLSPSWSILQGIPGQDWEVVDGSLFGSDSIQVNFITPGVYTIEMTIVSFACGEFVFTADIVVAEPPVFEADAIGIDSLIGTDGCAPLAIPFFSTGNQELDYNWSVSPATGWEITGGSDTTDAPLINFLEGGSYTITAMAANACEEVSWDTIINVMGPPTLILDALADSCEVATLGFSTNNLTYQINGDSIQSYFWEFPGSDTPTSTDSFPSNILYDTPGTYIVSLTADNMCGISTVQDTFEVQGAIALVMPPDEIVCVNADPFLLIADPPGGTWSGSGVNNNGGFTPLNANNGSNVLTYTYGVGACEVSDQMAVEVNALPNVEAGPAETVCASENALQLDGAPLGGQWTVDNGGVLNGDEFNATASGPGNYQLLYAYSDGNGCANQDSLEIVVHPLPDLSVSDTAYCDVPGSELLPPADPVGGTWSGPGVVNDNGLFDPITAGGAGTYLLDYTYTDNNGCTNVANINVDVAAPPNINAGPDISICITDGLTTLTGFDPPGGSWTGDGILDQSQALFDPVIAGSGTHELIYRVGDGNCIVFDTLEVTVIDFTGISAGPEQDACINDTPFQLIGNTPLGGFWDGAGITDPDLGTIDPQLAGVGIHTITYSIVDQSTGCTFNSQKTIEIFPQPETAFSVPELACTNDTVAFVNQSVGAGSFYWDFGDGNSSSDVWPSHAYTDTGSFFISLQVESAAGCTAETSGEITITEAPTADFVPDLESGCGPLSINLTDLSYGYDFSYAWDFGNGENSTNATPPALMFPPGINDTTYVIELEVTNLCGTNTHYELIEVYPLPVVNFGIEVDTGCAPLEVSFNNLTLGSPQSFYWDFGNGNISNDSIPGPQTFTTDTSITTYSITLIATNSCGADTLSHPLVVEPENVTAFFNASSTEGCAPFTVDFTNYASFGTFVSWDFGDGNIISLENPTHTFADPGTFTVIQYASNGCGYDSTMMEILVLPSPEASFTFPEILCENGPVQFTNTSNNIAGSYWEFGTGDTSILTNPSYLFDAVGTYEITLTTYAEQSGCSNSVSDFLEIAPAPIAEFSVSDPDGCAPFPISLANNSQNAAYYFWNFGDGNTSIELEPEHTYLDAGTYGIELIVTSINGCTDTTALNNLFAYPVPEAAFSFVQESLCGLPATIEFADESNGADGLEWHFGNGTISNQNNPVHLYDEPGTFSITLFTNNQYGCQDSTSQTVTTYPQPAADFDFQGEIGCEPLEVNFFSLASEANQHTWDFGDGSLSNEQNPTHTFTEDGLYNVQLIVSYDDVCFDSLQLDDLIDVWPSPTASFELVEDPVGEPSGTVQLVNNSTDAISYLWDFGDGSTSTETSPIHRYFDDVPVQIWLQAFGLNECHDDTLITLIPPVFGKLYVPNAFAPEQGAEGVRLFFPKGVGLKEYHLQIFSTYGQELWQTTKLVEGQPAEGWDGTYNGNLLPQDTYVWKIWAIFEDGTEWQGMPNHKGKLQRMGSVVLLR